MKETVRTGVWETNSSSIHSLTLCSEDVYNKWKNGLLLYTPYAQKFKSADEVDKEMIYNPETECDDDDLYYSYDNYWNIFINQVYGIQDTFCKTELIDGVKVKAFGYLGYD